MLTPEFRETTRDLGLLFFRIVIGGLMIVGHGYPKWANFAEKAEVFADPLGVGEAMSLWLAVGAEFFCAALVVIGLATRIACVPLIITMAVAAFIVHGGDPLGDKEMALVYGSSFVLLMLTGPGRLSIDGIISFLRRDA